APAPASAPTAPRASPSDNLDDVVVTARSRPAAPAAAERSVMSEDAGPPAEDARAASLRTAATAGRVAELRRLLAQGAPVDAVDAAGETALMKAVQANQSAAAALLRRRGADLDRTNAAGLSAREMARVIANPELDAALGVQP
ncbi:MAG: ankyrin repeat domain-containing protein, partial [Phenylobacterium sp.]